MKLRPPALDDRTFEQLVSAARHRAQETCEDWTDMSAGDPGTVLLELFAYLTETLLFRLNRLPEKAYVELLRLVGLKLHPASAARARLRFERDTENQAVPSIEIPRGTRVSASDGTTFATMHAVSIDAGLGAVEVPAVHCEHVDAELLGHGTGQPGLALQLASPPLARVGFELDRDESLLIGVETGGEESDGARTRKVGSRTYRIWSETEVFGISADPFVYVADRASGQITFAPAVREFVDDSQGQHPQALAATPAPGLEIRAWYLTGGGGTGNVAARQLTKLLDPLPGVSVTNPAPATGGRDAESVRNAILRGPQQLYARDRVVTKRDFEVCACELPSVARARASSKSEMWAHGAPGTVSLVVLPELDERQRPEGRVTESALRDRQTDQTLRDVLTSLDSRQPLGSEIEVRWADYQEVFARSTIRIHSSEDPVAIEQEVRRRLDALISPLPTARQPSGWPFEQALQLGRVYDEIFRVSGVAEVDSLDLVLSDAPTEPVSSLASDAHQADTWFSVSGNHLYRTMNAGETWRRCELPIDSENDPDRPSIVRTNPVVPGCVAIVASSTIDTDSVASVYVSTDCGQSWRFGTRFRGRVNDATWTRRDGVPSLLLSTEHGLYRWSEQTGEPEHVDIHGLRDSHTRELWTTVVTHDDAGNPLMVATAAKDGNGVWISYEGGLPSTFVSIGLNEHDIRTLAFQRTGSRTALWAGAAVIGSIPGRGAFRWTGPSPEWQQVVTDWRGGSCLSLRTHGQTVYATTHHAGVLRLDTSRSERMRWQASKLGCGLPSRDVDRPFQPIPALDVAPNAERLMVGSVGGVHRSSDDGVEFCPVGIREMNTIPLPPHTMFVAGNHELLVTARP